MTISLAQLEQEVARRTGPFFQAAQDSGSPTSSTTTSTIMPRLKTNALLGGPENLWLIRRGALVDGTATPSPIAAADRERMVQTFDSAAGRVIVDRNWGTPMYPNELADFTHLHPSQELRPAVLAGLRRCFFADTISVVPTGGYADTDLTYTAPWIVDPSQVLDVQYGFQRPTGYVPFKTAIHQGHVMLTAAIYGGAWVTALRPHWSWVNGTDSTTGPTADGDTLNVDMDYAAAAGHIEAWHLFPNRMFAAAAGNLQATQEMAAREFTRQALIFGPPPSREFRFSEVVSLPL
jgi:hypothetical protein